MIQISKKEREKLAAKASAEFDILRIAAVTHSDASYQANLYNLIVSKLTELEEVKFKLEYYDSVPLEGGSQKEIIAKAEQESLDAKGTAADCRDVVENLANKLRHACVLLLEIKTFMLDCSFPCKICETKDLLDQNGNCKNCREEIEDGRYD